jgi:hypothetical protein
MNIQKSMMSLFGSACLAYSLAYIYSEKKDIKTLTAIVVDGWKNGFIDDDAFVSKPIEYINSFSKDKKKNYDKVKIKTLDDLPSEGLYTVQYAYGNLNHFVVAKRGQIVFDSWENSNCVKFGKPISYRKIA